MIVYIKKEKTITKFGDIQIDKQKICEYKYKKPISIKNINIDRCKDTKKWDL